MKTTQNRAFVFVAIVALVSMWVFVSPGMLCAGDLEPPPSAVDGSGYPVPTMKTLDQIPPAWSQKLLANERFELVFDGDAVLDKETGLVWARNADLPPGYKTWQDAMLYCRNLALGGRKGWRLPTIEELASLVDPSRSFPALPAGHPFMNVQSTSYWSSTEVSGDSNNVWAVNWSGGAVGGVMPKNYSNYLWPVRGGK